MIFDGIITLRQDTQVHALREITYSHHNLSALGWIVGIYHIGNYPRKGEPIAKHPIEWYSIYFITTRDGLRDRDPEMWPLLMIPRV